MLLDLLIDHPGDQLESGWLADQIAGDNANGLAKPQLVARAFRDMRAAQTASGRRYPFYWWRENGSPAKYAMKRRIAELFGQARKSDQRGFQSARLLVGWRAGREHLHGGHAPR